MPDLRPPKRWVGEEVIAAAEKKRSVRPLSAAMTIYGGLQIGISHLLLRTKDAKEHHPTGARDSGRPVLPVGECKGSERMSHSLEHEPFRTYRCLGLEVQPTEFEVLQSPIRVVPHHHGHVSMGIRIRLGLAVEARSLTTIDGRKSAPRYHITPPMTTTAATTGYIDIADGGQVGLTSR